MSKFLTSSEKLELKESIDRFLKEKRVVDYRKIEEKLSFNCERCEYEIALDDKTALQFKEIHQLKMAKTT